MKISCKHPLYSTWRGMKGRCNNPNHSSYRWYGAKGVQVCERWLCFSNFAEDMWPRPDGYTIDRIDPSSGYNPNNCRWATRAEQSENISPETRLEAGRKVAEISRKRYCKNGHKRTPENTYYQPNGKVRCIKCRKTPLPTSMARTFTPGLQSKQYLKNKPRRPKPKMSHAEIIELTGWSVTTLKRHYCECGQTMMRALQYGCGGDENPKCNPAERKLWRKPQRT